METKRTVPSQPAEEKDYLQQVKEDGYHIQYVPKECITRLMCEIAIAGTLGVHSSRTDIFRFIPYPDLCLKAVRDYSPAQETWKLLQYIRQDIQNPSIIYEAVCKDPTAILYANRKLLTPEICRKVLKGYPEYYHNLPSAFKTPEFTLQAALNCSPYTIEFVTNYIPEEIKRGNNLYTFGMQLQRLSKEKLTFEKIEACYNGKPFQVDAYRDGQTMHKNPTLIWDKQKEGFLVQSIPPPTQKYPFFKGRKVHSL